jgi:hypothetical protein
MSRPTPINAYPTATSNLQADTENILQDHVPLEGGGGGCVLHKNRHLELLVRNLAQGFPARYVSQDASQPWLMFWTLQSFSALQIAIDPDTKQRCLSFSFLVSPCADMFFLWCLGQSILSCSGSTRMADSVVGPGRLRTYYLRTRLCALSRLLVAMVLEADGTKLTGALCDYIDSISIQCVEETNYTSGICL